MTITFHADGGLHTPMEGRRSGCALSRPAEFVHTMVCNTVARNSLMIINPSLIVPRRSRDRRQRAAPETNGIPSALLSRHPAASHSAGGSRRPCGPMFRCGYGTGVSLLTNTLPNIQLYVHTQQTVAFDEPGSHGAPTFRDTGTTAQARHHAAVSI